ncbi:MAG: hypothetical protein KC777_28005 [Cyanobacteria bacterium HKST-UBA02]|nr:hypothetical protein [Cyanobacteria bacterium HKST-UBA02]
MSDTSAIWTSTCESLGADSSRARRCLDDLTARYSEAHRHYHTMEHISGVLSSLARFEQEPSPAQIFAAFYHDAVYATRRHDNETKSAALARRSLETMGLKPELIETVEVLILSTINHQPLWGSRETLLFLDCDLITLGSPKDSYDRYSRSIRQEYDWVPEDKYREGRLKVLRSFTERREIFFVEEIRKQFESQARANLEAEIGVLEAAGR